MLYAVAHYNMQLQLVTRSRMYEKNSVLEIYVIVQLASAKSLSMSGASYHPAFMGNYPIISHTC